jgi:hypothetical protein
MVASSPLFSLFTYAQSRLRCQAISDILEFEKKVSRRAFCLTFEEHWDKRIMICGWNHFQERGDRLTLSPTMQRRL